MSGRAENDYYPTPDALASCICSRVASVLEPIHFDIIEPSAGSGAFVRPLRLIWQLQPLIAIDINPNVPALDQAGADEIVTGDYVEWLHKFKCEGPVLVIGNPPFSLAALHIAESLDYLVPGSHIAFLLKMNFFGSKDRQPFWRLGQLRYFIPILGRPSFVKGEKSSTDFNEYAVFIWEVGYSGKPEILFPHIVWKP